MTNETDREVTDKIIELYYEYRDTLGRNEKILKQVIIDELQVTEEEAEFMIKLLDMLYYYGDANFNKFDKFLEFLNVKIY